ncbi:MAG: ATP-binding protein [Syntrophus sp. (in: bacteria)]
MHKQILILRSYGYGREGPERYNRYFVSTLISDGISAADVMVEYLDLNRNQDKEFHKKKRELLLHQYRQKKIDLIVAVEQPALNFLLKELRELMNGIPILAITAKVPTEVLKKTDRFVQKAVNLDFKGTIDRALELFPETQRVIIVTGTGEQDLTAKKQSQQIATLWQGRLEFEYTDQLSFNEILKHLANLPPKTIVVFRTFNKDNTGESFVPYEAVVRIAKVANAPVFGLFDNYVGIGVVGGSVYHIQREAERAAQEVTAILNGEMQLTRQLTELSSQGIPMFDWQQIERWGGSKKRLPPESIIINRPLTLWGQYKIFVIGSICIILALSSMVIALMIQNRRRSEAELALRVSEERYRNICENAVLGIYQATPEGRFISVNNAFARMAGYDSPEEMIDTIKDISLQFYVNPKDRQKFIEIINANDMIKSFGAEYYKKDRSIFWVLVNARVVKDHQGRIIYYEGIAADVTQQRQAEEENRRLEGRLIRAEKMEALGTLAGGVAHDLNNVLGIVVGYSEMLMDEIDESNPLRNDLMKIMEGGNRSAAIVQDLLTLARRGVQSPKVINLNAVITDYQKTPEFENAISSNYKVRIKTELEADLLNIMGSPMHLTKTIMNLVTNALEAMPAVGMLTITTSNQSLDKPVRGYDTVNEGDYAVVSIADTGDGISDNDIKHIFEPFYTKKVMGRSGTGLGLAVVWGTVKDHNGYIDVQSEVGKGTTFTLYFPITREEIIKKETAIPLSDYIGNDESILVIDDIKEQRDLAAKMLGKLNYKVRTVSSGEEGVQYLRTEKADLIILDMIMDPGMDGLDAYKAILEIHPKQKAIIVSGFSETDRVKEARILGAGDYLRKPYVQEKLGMAVRKELDRK